MRMTIGGRLPESGASVILDVEEGRIAAIRPGPEEESRWLSHGLVDLQVNGYGGRDINAQTLDVEEVIALGRAMLNEGVTTFLPTIITSPEAKIIHALRTIAAARDQDAAIRAMIPGVHLEGPSISAEDGPRGAHPAQHIRPPDFAEFVRWQQACGNLVKMVTLSPHFPGSVEYIRRLSAAGVHVSLGHTHCDHQQIVAAVNAGASLSTHLGNGAHGVLPRHPNYIWSQLADERLAAMFIADGYHLPAETLVAMLRAKGLDKAILVSDSSMPGGMPPGEYETPVGGRVTLDAAGRLGLTGSAFLAGAALPLRYGVAFCAALPGVSLSQALTMATVNPAARLNQNGRLAPGETADIIRFSWAPGHPTLDIEQCWLRGQPVR